MSRLQTLLSMQGIITEPTNSLFNLSTACRLISDELHACPVVHMWGCKHCVIHTDFRLNTTLEATFNESIDNFFQ